jgi:hypothetical protein
MPIRVLSAVRGTTEEFFELVLGNRRWITLVASYDDPFRPPVWRQRWFAPHDAAAASAWVLNDMRGHHAYVEPHGGGRQYAAVVKFEGEAIANLALTSTPPSLALTWGDPQTVQAVWLFDEPVQWFPSSNLSHAIARRLGGRAAARILVPETRAGPIAHDYVNLVPVTRADHIPERLRADLRKGRGTGGAKP